MIIFIFPLFLSLMERLAVTASTLQANKRKRRLRALSGKREATRG